MSQRAFSGVVFIFLLTGMFVSALNIQPARGEPRTWTVDDDGPADFHTIQEAINAASDGDTVFVHNGTYVETVRVNRSLSLVGEDRVYTIVDGNATSYASLGLFAESTMRLETGASSNVTGFTIRNGGYGVQTWGGFIVPVFTGHRIEDNQIMDNLYGGVLLRGCANNTVSNNIVANNTLFGIHMWDASNNTITNNTVESNGHGIDLYSNTNNNFLRNNNMTNNQYNFGPVLRGHTWNFLSSGLTGSGSEVFQPGLCNDVDTSNTVNGKPIYCWVNRNHEQVSSDAGYVWLNNCTDITVNGLNLSGNLQGIMLQSTNGTSVTNCTITNNVDGIWLWDSNNNSLTGNTLRDNVNGVYLGDISRFTTMRNNSIDGGQRNFGMPNYNMRYAYSVYIDPLGPFAEFINDIDASNTVNGKPIVYWMNQYDRKVPTNAGCIVLINCTNILVQGLNISNNAQGILAIASNNTVVTNNSISANVYGIDVRDVGYFTQIYSYTNYTYVNYASSGTTVHANTISDNGVGIRVFSGCPNCTITRNALLHNPLGIYLRGDASGNVISSNTVIGNTSNISFYSLGPDFDVFFPETAWERSDELNMLLIGGIVVGGDSNLVCGNTVAHNYFGICIGDPLAADRVSGNLVFHNNFIDNSPVGQAWTGGGLSLWFLGYPSGGNYWSDYNGTDLYSGPYQNETGSDAIGDTPYVIDAVNIDLAPLMQPYIPILGDLSQDEKVDIFDAILAALSFGSYPGHPRWNFEADLNEDNVINILDIIILAANFGKH